jgi:hypothetical protein
MANKEEQIDEEEEEEEEECVRKEKVEKLDHLFNC